MDNYLITPTLLNSFSYYMSEYGKREDFLKTLKRERSEPTLAMQKGNDFEYLIEKHCKAVDSKTWSWPRLLASKCQKLKSLKISDYESALTFIKKNKKYLECIEKISNLVKGGVWQARLSKEIEIGGVSYVLYGKSDVIKQNFIYDIKFATKTRNYDVGKFQPSTQHLIYLYCTGLTDFAFIISDGKEWWREDYQTSKDIESDIKGRITEFRDYLSGDKEAENLFLTKWISQ